MCPATSHLTWCYTNRMQAFYSLLLSRILWLALILPLLMFACAKSSEITMTQVRNVGWKSKKIAPESQLTNGNAARGFEYMKEGSYLGTGLPASILRPAIERDSVKFFRNSNILTPHGIAFFETANGVEVTNGTCFTCHAGAVAGDTILGLGNSLSDYRGNLSLPAKLLDVRMRVTYKEDDPEYVQYEDFGRYFRAMTEGTQTNNPGVNPAARIAETIMRYRDPQTLEYVSEPAYEIEDYNIASDTPPLWNVVKKNSLYYTAVGRGDMTKLLFQASVLGIPDSMQARRAQNAFVDVLAWLRELEPPRYTGEVDPVLAKAGKLIFEENCSGCHGTYGEIGGDRSDDTYPNIVVSVDVVRTDPLYASYAVNSGITDWYNRSWFATSYPQSRFEPEAGYVAPPLDGIWATAPYLHNGSVPTLGALLNSYERPKYWARYSPSHPRPVGEANEYDHDLLGWKVEVRENAKGKYTYNTSLRGYGNEGHTFGDHLSTQERKDVIEYLKTL